MSNTMQELYDQVVSSLSPTERLHLATLILNDLVPKNGAVDYSDGWTEQDQQDLLAFSLQYIVLESSNGRELDELYG